MNDEIKEILDNIDIWYKENDLDYSRWFGLEELKQLKDYIINLQKENIELVKQRDNYKSKVDNALGLAFEYGQIDGSHHRVWCIDQMVRELADDYDNFIQEYEEDGEYKWDIGIHP